jgi:hypothetical protein
MDDVPAQLIVKRGPEPNRKYTLSQPVITIGRSKKSGIVLTDPEVSRTHARITREGEIYLIEDLGSTNATFVNGNKINIPSALYNGDEIRFGDTFTFQFWHMAVDPEEASDPSLATSSTDETVVDLVGIPPADLGEVKTSTAISPEIVEEDEFQLAPEIKARGGRRRWLWGCGCLILFLVFICGATIFFLDAYEGGRLLYCGPLRPFFQLLLGPLGFAPPCG